MDSQIDDLKVLVDIITSQDFIGSLSTSIYETCFYLSSDSFKKTNENLIWVENYLNNIKEKQDKAGFWSEWPEINYLPDQVINTLIIVITLKTFRLLDNNILKKATDFLNSFLVQSFHIDENKKTIAFEGIVLMLVHRLKKLNINLKCEEHLNDFEKIFDAKIQKKLNDLYRKRNTLHSVLDIFYNNNNLNWNQLTNLQEVNGSFGIYPSSTIAVMRNIQKDSDCYEKGSAYIKRILNTYNNSLVPFAPSDNFEKYWSLVALYDSPLRNNLMLNNPEDCNSFEKPISVSDEFSLDDCDTTAMYLNYKLLRGDTQNIEMLDKYYKNGIFLCYEYENRISLSANIHVLMAIVKKIIIDKKSFSRYKEMILSVLSYIFQALDKNISLDDKWHLSSLYTTSHCAELFIDLLKIDDLDQSIKVKMHYYLKEIFLLFKRNEISSGVFGGLGIPTVEETSYVGRVLCKLYLNNILQVDSRQLRSMKTYIQKQYNEIYPTLWLGKTLYTSKSIVDANKMSALAFLSKCKV